MSDDLIERLRQQAHNRTAHFDADAYKATPEWQAATLIEAQAAEIERLTAERDADNMRLKVQRDNALLDMEAFMDRAETAERALGEAVEALRPFAKAGDLLQFAGASRGDEIELSGEQLHTAIESARNFVKEHGK